MTYKKEFGNCTGPFGFPMQEEVAREVDKLLEEHTKDEYLQYRRKSTDNAPELVIVKERTDVAVITDGSIDKDREIVSPEGVKFDWFEKSRVVTFNHQYWMPPVGKCLWYKRVGDSWKAKTRYASRPKDHPNNLEWIPDTIFHMTQERMMRGNSIGFLPSKWHEPTKEDREKSIDHTKADLIFDEIYVFEYAKCAVQCNNNAITEEVAKGVIQLSEEAFGNQFKEIRDAVEQWKEKKNGEITREQEIDTLIIKGTTLSQKKEQKKQLLEKEIRRLVRRTPQIVEDTFARLLGKV